MRMAIQLLLSLVLVGIALFCVFGFLCTYEELPRRVQITWRSVYVGMGLACTGGLFLVWRRKRSGK